MIARSLVLLAAAAITACYPVEEVPRRRGGAVPRHAPVIAEAMDQERPVVTPVQPAGSPAFARPPGPPAGTLQVPAARTTPGPVAAAAPPRTPAIRPATVPQPEGLAPQPSARPTPQAGAPSVIPPTAPSAAPPAAPGGPVTARKAPGRAGFVISPHTGKLMLVRGIPSGTIVPDQTCPPGEKQVFRVP